MKRNFPSKSHLWKQFVLALRRNIRPNCKVLCPVRIHPCVLFVCYRWSSSAAASFHFCIDRRCSSVGRRLPFLPNSWKLSLEFDSKWVALSFVICNLELPSFVVAPRKIQTLIQQSTTSAIFCKFGPSSTNLPLITIPNWSLISFHALTLFLSIVRK